MRRSPLPRSDKPMRRSPIGEKVRQRVRARTGIVVDIDGLVTP